MNHSCRILCLLCDGFEELEAIAPVDLLRRSGVEVTMASLGNVAVMGRNGIHLMADARFDEVDPSAFDMLLLPGGPGVAFLRADGRAAECVGAFIGSGRPVAAICAAPLILKDAGVLEGRRFTAFPGVRGELPGCIDERVVQDGLIITSRGAGTAVDFALALVAELCGAEKAGEIARQIAH